LVSTRPCTAAHRGVITSAARHISSLGLPARKIPPKAPRSPLPHHASDPNPRIVNPLPSHKTDSQTQSTTKKRMEEVVGSTSRAATPSHEKLECERRGTILTRITASRLGEGCWGRREECGRLWMWPCGDKPILH
jgi:hypothetical protein